MCKALFFFLKNNYFLEITYYNVDKVGDKVSDNLQKKKHIKNVFYLSRFMAKAFLMAIFGILSIICLIFIIYFADVLINLNRGVYKYPLFGAYVIVSPSMVPTINVGDGIVIKRSSDNELKIGDIITFSSKDIRYSGLTVTHRIVNKKQTKTGNYIYRTKGDHNDMEDPSSVSLDNIYGKVILKIPKIGYVQQFLSKPINFILVFVGIISVVLIYDGIRIAVMVGKKA